MSHVSFDGFNISIVLGDVIYLNRATAGDLVFSHGTSFGHATCSSHITSFSHVVFSSYPTSLVMMSRPYLKLVRPKSVTAREEDESLPVHFQRYCTWLRRDWHGLSEDEKTAICDHLLNNDLPETRSVLNLRLVRQGWTTPEIEFIKGVTVPHGSKILFLNKRIVYGRGIFWNDYWDPLLMESSMFARK